MPKLIPTKIELTVAGASQGYALRNPHVLYQEANRAGYATHHWWGKPNSYYCPRGREAGRAYVLLSRKQAVALSLTAPYDLLFTYGDTTLRIPELYVLHATAIYTDSYAPDDSVTYLVELADLRIKFPNTSINEWYNVRNPCDEFYDSSLLIPPSTLWPWQDMLDDIWSNLPGDAGASPPLPSAPSGDPENFRFIGISAWHAYCDVLERISCDIVYDPITSVFTVVDLGAVQSGMTKLETDTDLISDRVPRKGQIENPAAIRVFFPDTDNIEQAPATSYDCTTGLPGAPTGTILPVWNDMGAEAGPAACQARAIAVGTAIAAKYNVQDGARRKIFYGLKDIIPGSQIEAVRWSDKGDSLGMTTEYWGSPVEWNYPRLPEAKTVCCNLVSPTDCWIGCYLGKIRHKQPYTNLNIADCTKAWWLDQQNIVKNGLRWYFDDAGHIIGFLGYDCCWYSPWIAAEPVGNGQVVAAFPVP